MARTWLSIQVELVGGRGEYFWPRPGRILAASRSHTFAQLAEAINAAFARWDPSHLYQFTMGDGRLIGLPELDDVEEMLDAHATKLSTVATGDRFAFEFDFGDAWTHLCTVGDKIDAEDELGITPGEPLSYFGWGTIPDQYGRQSSDDDEEEPPPDPGRGDLPALIDW